MTRLAWFVVNHRKAVLVVTVLLLVVAGVVGGGVVDKADKGNFLLPPSSESSRAAEILAQQFHHPEPNLVLLVTARRGTVDSPPVAREGAAITAEATRLIGSPASSYWTLGSPPPLRSKDATQALVLGRIPGSDNQVDQRIGRIASLLERHDDVIDVTVTGSAQITHQSFETARQDARRGEVLAGPLLLLMLFLVFGSAVAAALPLAIAALVVAFTFVALRLAVEFTYVHDNMLNLITIVALGLAVDYCLFIVSRFREELAAGREPHAAVVRTMQTAGVTVLVSAATVSVALAALLVFPSHTNSWALTGLAAVIAGLGAVVVLPALLAVLGGDVDRLRLFHRPPTQAGKGFWHRLATTVMRRPLPIATASAAFLVLLGAPFLNVELSLPDERWLPTGSTSRQGLAEIRRNFTDNDPFALSIVAPASGDPTGLRSQLTHYASALSALPGVARVDGYTGTFSGGRQVAPETPISRQRFSDQTGRGTWLSLVPDVGIEPLSGSGERLVHRIRAARRPFPVFVGGQSAQLVDSKDAILGRLPLALALLALLTLITLFMMFGSVLVPIKAVILNVLSLTSTFGAMVWVFQEGHGADVLNFTPAGALDAFALIMIFCIAFGLSMDYEVFLLSRIKEEHDHGADNIRSVAIGLEHTGRIVTAAAACLAIVFLSQVAQKTFAIKLFGLGMALAVLVDATVIRGLLVPAFMRLAGNANWWAPRPLRRLYERVGFHHAAQHSAPAPAYLVELPDEHAMPKG